MQCIRPIKAGFDLDGNITYNWKRVSRELVGVQFDCRKCLPCRLKQAREKAVRAVHEASQHEHNIFLTLTYADEHLASPRLVYSDWQLFMKSLRERRERGITDPEIKKMLRIGAMVTGEYGDKNKRPHWHAILFNYEPKDKKLDRKTELGEQIFTSEEISNLWKKGKTEFGSVTIESAGYVARYAAKKLSHGKDQDHDYHPIHKTSCRQAMGKSWIQKYWKQTFDLGYIHLPNGQKSAIPRYYVDWLKVHQPEAWLRYVTELRPKTQALAEAKSKKEYEDWLPTWEAHKGKTKVPMTRSKVKETILKAKFKQIQERQKL